MSTSRRTVLGASAGATAFGGLPWRSARAQAANTIRVGVLNDQSGPYRDLSGPYGVQCTLQAVQEFGNRGFNIEVINADHQNKPDVGANIARQWYDQGVDMILDVPTSSVGLAVNNIAREKNKAYVNTGSATSDLTGPACSPNTVHWMYDTYMLAKSTGGAMVKAGGDSWFFLTADYAFGHALERDTANFVRNAGGRVLGSVRYPFPATTDFSSFLLQAQASRAKVIGMANAGADAINTVKQASEFGLLRRGIKLAALLMFLPDIHAIGLQTAQGLVLTESFYWDLNDRTRALTQRLQPRLRDQKPNMASVANYSAMLHYLKAIADMGVPASKASGLEVINRMKALPCDDDAFGAGVIRPDGRKLCPSYLFEVKSPAESKGVWDYYKLLQTTPAEEAFRPINEGNCPLIRA
jgi:branched-chain amino acid transport system substrate-binding protein